MRFPDNFTLQREARALRARELNRIARSIALKWTTWLDLSGGYPPLAPLAPCPEPAPNHRPESPATPNA
jgi:hypothetical protein